MSRQAAHKPNPAVLSPEGIPTLPLARLELRRRAVAFVPAGTLPAGLQPTQLRLHAAAGTPCRTPCVRPDGLLYFVDLPPGRCALQQVDGEGQVLASIEIELPPALPGSRQPFAIVGLDFAAQTTRPAPAARARHRVTTTGNGKEA